jgi:endonuclease III
MVDPFAITKYDRSKSELEEMLLFCVLVAGKPARRTAAQLEKLLEGHNNQPFARMRKYIREGILPDKLKAYGFGQYNRLMRCFAELLTARLNLFQCTAADLDAIHGIGPKTAAFFITHSRLPKSIDEDEVILDTHNMKHIAKNVEWLVQSGNLTIEQAQKIPKNTPSSEKGYQLYGNCFRALVKRDSPRSTMAEYDLNVWKSYARVTN